MSLRSRLRWIVIALLLSPGPEAAAAPPKPAPAPLAETERFQRALEELSKRVQASVVNVRRFEKDEAWWARTRRSAGADTGWRVVPVNDRLYPNYRPVRGSSGYVVSADGYIITVRRAVVDPRTHEPAEIVSVEIGLQHLRAEVVSLEPTLDIAVLKIKSDAPLPYLRFGDSSKSRAGHWVVAFGDPDGAVRTMIPGFVAVPPSRECYQDDLSATYLQLSMLVPDGALGGPLVNLNGEVIGTNARLGSFTPTDPTAPAAGAGFALPSNITNGIYQAMLMKGSMESPWLGISVLALNDTLRKQLGDPKIVGIYIDNVYEPSPAAAAGIQVGDVLRSIDDAPIPTVYEFQRLLYEHGAGSRIRLGMTRAGKKLEVPVTVERRPPGTLTR